MSDNLGADEPFLSFIFFRLRTFKWDPERTPLSSFAAPAFAIVFYLVALVALKIFVKQRDRYTTSERYWCFCKCTVARSRIAVNY